MKLFKITLLGILGMFLATGCTKDSFSTSEKSILWKYDQTLDTYYADISDSRINDFVITNGSVDVEIKADNTVLLSAGYEGLPATILGNEVVYSYSTGNVHLECFNLSGTDDPIADLGLGTVKITVFKDLRAKMKSTPSFEKVKINDYK